MIEETTERLAVAEPEGLDEFLDAYIEAALWSSTDNANDNGGEPLDKNYDQGDIDPETRARMKADCIEFLNHWLGGRLVGIAERLEAKGRWSLPRGADCTVMAYAGHDLWLTRNGNGCGFWDGDWPDGVGEGLDKIAHDFGTFELYVGDDGLIHGC